MGCTSGVERSAVIKYTSESDESSSEHFIQYPRSYEYVIWTLREQNEILRYQNFRLIDVNTSAVIENEDTFRKCYGIDNGQTPAKVSLNLKVDIQNLDPAISSLGAKLNSFMGRIVKLIDPDRYINRLGYLLASKLLLITTCGLEKSTSEFIYQDENNQLQVGKIDYKEFYYRIEDQSVALVATSTIQPVMSEQLLERPPPRSVLILTANKESPQIRVSPQQRAYSHRENYITYSSNLKPTSTGSLIIDYDTKTPIGIHLKTSKLAVKQTGQALLFSSLLKSLKTTQPDGLEQYGQFIGTEDQEESGLSLVLEEEAEEQNSSSGEEEIKTLKPKVGIRPDVYADTCNDIIPEESESESIDQQPSIIDNPDSLVSSLAAETDRTFPTFISEITVNAKSMATAVFTRSAMYLTSENLLHVYDPIQSSYRSTDISSIVTFAPGISIASTMAMTILTGLSEEGNNTTLTVSRKFESSLIQSPQGLRQHHASAILANSLYVISGELTQTVEIYSFLSKTWEEGPSLPFRLAKCTSIVSNGQLYVAGGIKVATQKHSSSIRCLEGENWVKITAKLPSMCLNTTIVPVTLEKLLILGGQELGTYNEKIEVIDLSTNDSRRIGPDIDTSIPLQSTPSSIMSESVYMFLNEKQLAAINLTNFSWEKIRIEIQS